MCYQIAKTKFNEIINLELLYFILFCKIGYFMDRLKSGCHLNFPLFEIRYTNDYYLKTNFFVLGINVIPKVNYFKQL